MRETVLAVELVLKMLQTEKENSLKIFHGWSYICPIRLATVFMNPLVSLAGLIRLNISLDVCRRKKKLFGN